MSKRYVVFIATFLVIKVTPAFAQQSDTYDAYHVDPIPEAPAVSAEQKQEPKQEQPAPQQAPQAPPQQQQPQATPSQATPQQPMPQADRVDPSTFEMPAPSPAAQKLDEMDARAKAEGTYEEPILKEWRARHERHYAYYGAYYDYDNRPYTPQYQYYETYVSPAASCPMDRAWIYYRDENGFESGGQCTRLPPSAPIPMCAPNERVFGYIDVYERLILEGCRSVYDPVSGRSFYPRRYGGNYAVWNGTAWYGYGTGSLPPREWNRQRPAPQHDRQPRSTVYPREERRPQRQAGHAYTPRSQPRSAPPPRSNPPTQYNLRQGSGARQATPQSSGSHTTRAKRTR